jgi:DNA-binding beta-propeller fold protein YncE
METATQTGPAIGPGAAPRFTLESAPAVTLPEGRHLGAVTGVQVSPDGHIWVLHIASNKAWGPPGSTAEDAVRLPAVCEFDAEGNYLQGWGGPDWLPRENGLQQWPRQEETIAFDDDGTLWVFGADVSYDHAVQRFTRDGKLLLRIGRFGEAGTDDTPGLLGCPTDAWHDVKRRELYVTDGYVNHRVAVFNSDTGAFLRAWGAYGEPPRPARQEPREAFNNPVHAVSLGPEGHLYVCDRKNDRVQVFDAVGKGEPRFVREIELNRESPFGTCFNLVFTPDGRFMVINDGNNSRLAIVDLAVWDYVDDFHVPGADEGDLAATVHKITGDGAGNLILGRTTHGVRRMRYAGAGTTA